MSTPSLVGLDTASKKGSACAKLSFRLFARFWMSRSGPSPLAASGFRSGVVCQHGRVNARSYQEKVTETHQVDCHRVAYQEQDSREQSRLDSDRFLHREVAFFCELDEYVSVEGDRWTKGVKRKVSSEETTQDELYDVPTGPRSPHASTEKPSWTHRGAATRIQNQQFTPILSTSVVVSNIRR